MNKPGLFDAEYFNVSQEDALSMDPQQRLALELSRELIAHAGYTKDEVASTRTSVFIGAMANNYLRNNYSRLPENVYKHAIVNSISNMIAARISNFYDLKGSSQVIDTACSSALVAIHKACEDILLGKTTMAIAGGVSIMVDAFSHIGFSQANVLAKDGRSYVFDKRADGFVMGEGAGLILLKDYDQAIADGDQIFATIIGSALNNDGYTMGLTVPNKEGQKKVIEEALDTAQISTREITYYEAHGTGTLLGDPIEVKAATEVYRTQSTEKQYCAIGSVKSNLGHTMAAAGVAGLMKILLQMKHGQLVPTLNCENPHPRFKFHESPFYPITQLEEWKAERKIAAISSFGFGGTNSHIILEAENTSQSTSKRISYKVQRLTEEEYWLGENKNEGQFTPSKNEINIMSPKFNKKLFRYGEPYLKDHLVRKQQVILGVTYASIVLDELTW